MDNRDSVGALYFSILTRIVLHLYVLTRIVIHLYVLARIVYILDMPVLSLLA